MPTECAPHPIGVNMPPALSIVIPSYNCADLVSRAVESAYAFSEHTVEVIVVDDGSTDATTDVLAALLVDFPALRVIRQANGGLSSARNTGIYSATGRYVVLLDADDELLPVGRFTEINHGADMVRLGVEEVEIDGVKLLHVEPSTQSTGLEYLAICLKEKRFYTPSWAYAYRLDWLRTERLAFVHGLIHEDNLFTVEALLVCHSFIATPTLAYRYIRRPGTITTGTDNARILKRVDSLAEISRRLTAYANHFPEADIGWWALNAIDYAAVLAKQTNVRAARWKVLLMDFRFFMQYQIWGQHRRRRDVRYRLRQRLEQMWL